MYEIGDTVTYKGRLFAVVGFDGAVALLKDDENNVFRARL